MLNKDLKKTIADIDNAVATLNANGDALMTIASIRATLKRLYDEIGDDKDADKLCKD